MSPPAAAWLQQAACHPRNNLNLTFVEITLENSGGMNGKVKILVSWDMQGVYMILVPSDKIPDVIGYGLVL